MEGKGSVNRIQGGDSDKCGIFTHVCPGDRGFMAVSSGAEGLSICQQNFARTCSCLGQTPSCLVSYKNGD